jgi:methylenetetrahydrofolate dehydrogenase (NADP+)/methenyltetrahydrofolate cyclohydrolase
MAATIIDGREAAARIRADVAREVEELVGEAGRRPGLATILVGDDPASEVYVANKRKVSAEVGIVDFHRHLPADASQSEVAGVIEQCNKDPDVSGILLQLPVPEGLNGPALTGRISADKDVDGLTPISAGRLMQNTPGLRPCTPLGILELLDLHDVRLEGTEAVVIGRSDLVGRPMASMLVHRNATVTVCHSRTRNLPEVCSRADVLVAAVGQPRLVGPQYVKPGAVVVDVGINRTEEGLVGDIDFDSVLERASLITPVPGGVGPMTPAMLLRNTVLAARMQLGGEPGYDGPRRRGETVANET